jgi:CheY-like chemotaxis protein
MRSNTILLVEDDYVDIMNVERGLKKLGVDYTLHIAHNGVDALALLNGNMPGKEKIFPDIILLDINMPKMNGIEFLRIVRNYFTFNNIKIFITTTSVEEYDKLSTEQLGIYAYILKPLKFDTAKVAPNSGMDKLLAELL